MTTELQAAAVSIKHTEEHADTQKRIAQIERLRQIARNNYEVFSRRAEKLKDKFPEYAAECEEWAADSKFEEGLFEILLVISKIEQCDDRES